MVVLGFGKIKGYLLLQVLVWYASCKLLYAISLTFSCKVNENKNEFQCYPQEKFYQIW